MNAAWKPPTAQWTTVQRAMLGVHALVRAYEAFRRFVTQPVFQQDYDAYVEDYAKLKLERRRQGRASRKRKSGASPPAAAVAEDLVELSSSSEEADEQDTRKSPSFEPE